MSKSKVVTQIVKPIAKAWAKHMAYEEGISDKPSITGKIIHKIGLPICRIIGSFKVKPCRI
jgi:hypothetical protein